MNVANDYRYPGSRPFLDTNHDRRLFFGRDDEKQALFQLVLAVNLTVLFAKSGMGKTSLLNAGILQALREQGLIPLKIRFNDPAHDPLHAIYTGVKDAAIQQQIDLTPGEEESLWQYFSAAEFWSLDDKLLTPVLILDQFEEFFIFYTPEQRQALISQLADLVKGRIPKNLREILTTEQLTSYCGAAPGVKVLISLREDYLGQLEELSADLPEIFQNRFRLDYLHRDQAAQAIIQPAQLDDETLNTGQFTFAPEAVAAMLDFLCQQRQKSGMAVTDQVEPAQLQLLCQHIEQTVGKKQEKNDGNIVVQENDLGGERGMQRVLQTFYDRQLKGLKSFRKRQRVRKLCQKGLLSSTDRRLSLEQEDIQRRFKVSKNLLEQMIDSRLLRAETRSSGVYYELSHDTLVAPIRKSQKKHRVKAWILRGVAAMLLLVVLFYTAEAMSRNYAAIQVIKTVLTLPEYLFAVGYTVLGNALWGLDKYDEAEMQYRKAIELYPFFWAYSNLGDTLVLQGKFDEAIAIYQQTIEIDSKRIEGYLGLGFLFYTQGNYDEAMMQFQKAIAIAPNSTNGYSWAADVLRVQGRYDEAIAYYDRAFQLADHEWADVYIYRIAGLLTEQGKYDEAIARYQQIIAREPKNARNYVGLGEAFHQQGEYDKAIVQYRKALDLFESEGNYSLYEQIGNTLYLQGKYEEAFNFYQKAYQRFEKDYKDNVENIIWIKHSFAKYHLLAGHTEQAYVLAKEELERQVYFPAHRLGLRVIMIAALLAQNKHTQALSELQDLRAYYDALTAFNPKMRDYESMKNVIRSRLQLSEADKNLLLQLIDLFESPKFAEGEQKLKALLETYATTP